MLICWRNLEYLIWNEKKPFKTVGILWKDEKTTTKSKKQGLRAKNVSYDVALDGPTLHNVESKHGTFRVQGQNYLGIVFRADLFAPEVKILTYCVCYPR